MSPSIECLAVLNPAFMEIPIDEDSKLSSTRSNNHVVNCTSEEVFIHATPVEDIEHVAVHYKHSGLVDATLSGNVVAVVVIVLSAGWLCTYQPSEREQPGLSCSNECLADFWRARQVGPEHVAVVVLDDDEARVFVFGQRSVQVLQTEPIYPCGVSQRPGLVLNFMWQTAIDLPHVSLLQDRRVVEDQWARIITIG